MSGWRAIIRGRGACHRRRGRQTSRHALARQARGFSLIEVMIATGVFAMIAGVLFSALWSGQAQIARLSRASSEDEQLLTTRRILKSWIEAATVAGVGSKVGSQGGTPVFHGEAYRMVFNATPAARDGAGGLYRVEIGIARRESRAGTLSIFSLKRQHLDVVSGHTTGPLEEAVLLTTLRPLLLAYGDEIGTAAAGDGQRWMDDWAEPERMPTRIQLHDGETPLATIAIAVGKDARCVLKRGPEAMAGGECLVR